MNNTMVNFTTPEESMDSTTFSIGQMDSLKMCIFIIIFLFGLPSNSYIVWLIVTGRESGVASGFFNLNLSVCEIGCCMIAFFYLLSNLFLSLKAITSFLQGLTITGRPLFQCLIFVERYLAVVHPVTFLHFKPLRYKVICSTPAWIITLGSCLVCLYCAVSLNTKMYTWFYLLQFLLYLSIQLFCLLAVLRALKQSRPGERERKREEENQMKRRAFYLILITTVNIVILYIPFTFIGFVTILTELNIDALRSQLQHLFLCSVLLA
ncbi:hydroxycarboxylic acid receptor 2-like [Myxocyprinus asiaticus]|uniref:hydroxycarboxylic acid receptor 2-like n=1 Tax=Myxocyprinus asiaticus TaxID=70543 RepID=UPI0022235974|nr:hydroxycarboxylic acid receptor 2-like [Myxocyprinus asiaticus]